MGFGIWRINKKLRDFARFWLSPNHRSGQGSIEESGKLWNIEIPESWKISGEKNVFEFLPQNYDAINWFLFIQTQWRTGPHGVIGLDYGEALRCVQPLADGSVLCPVTNIRLAMEGLKIIEMYILEMLNKKP